ncbi:MAG TPA: universal stress protein [Pirellulaceae bacterium]|nr:universal stress protein [Pirellulaceae bacterium]
MSNMETILVATALDRRDATTLRHTARLAHVYHPKTIVIAHVEPPLDLPATVGPPATPTGDATIEARLHRLIEEHRGSFPTSTQLQFVIRYGARVPELLQLATERSADLLVLSRRPRDEHDALSDAVVKLEWKSPCSVVIVPDETPASYERILVACDFSPHSLEAVRAAADIARATPGSQLTIQHVHSLPGAAIMAGRSSSELSAIMREEAQQQWNKLAASLDLGELRYSLRFDESDSVPRAVTAAASELDAQLIVVGSHGRSTTAGALLGHVADTVCARTTRPFLCVKRKGEVVSLIQSLLGLYGNG